MPSQAGAGAPKIRALDRTEHFGQIVLSNTNTKYKLPTGNGNMPTQYWLWGMMLWFMGRVTNAAANNPTGVQADAPFSLIEYVRVKGKHLIRSGAEETITYLRGRELRELHMQYSGGNPLSLPASLDTAANATNDIKFPLLVPFVPLGVSPWEAGYFLLDAPNYDPLEFEVQFGDDKQVFSGQTAASTFSAYGSAAGSPVINIDLIYAIGGPQKFAGFVPGRCVRTFTELTAGDIVNTADPQDARLFNLNKGHRIRSLLLKTGTKAVVSAGNNAYATHSDAIVSNLRVNFGQRRPIRYYRDFAVVQEEARRAYTVAPSPGYALIDFCRNGSLREGLNTQGLTAGPTGETDLYLEGDIDGAANQAMMLVTEELRHIPAQFLQRAR